MFDKDLTLHHILHIWCNFREFYNQRNLKDWEYYNMLISTNKMYVDDSTMDVYVRIQKWDNG
jgi:hypothetical protein